MTNLVSENCKDDSETINDSTRECEITKSNNGINLTVKHESPEEEASRLKLIALIDHDYCKLSNCLTISNRTTHLQNGSLENDERCLLNGLPSNSMMGSILNKSSVQKLANKSPPGKMQPLQISIPEAFESTSKKQILVLKNKDIVPVNFDPKSKVLIDPVTIQKKVNNVNNDVGKEVCKINEKSKLLKINPVNSILLTSNYSEPALKIVDSSALSNDVSLLNFECSNSSRSKDFQNVLSTKSKIVLGKFKTKTVSNWEIYEGVMR